jgi:hypothetical protein
MVKYKFLNFLYKKEIAEGTLSNIFLAGALAGGDTGEIEDLKPQQLKISQEKIKEKHKISDEESKIFASLKARGIQDHSIDYLINFFSINHISLINLNVPKKDIDFYRVLKSGNIIGIVDLNKMNKEKPMKKEEREVLYGMANDWKNYLRNDAFGFSTPSQNKEIYLPNDLLKFLVFNEKYKIDNDIGIGGIRDFLEKYKINWGDIDGVKKVMKNYYDVLDNYKIGKP